MSAIYFECYELVSANLAAARRYPAHGSRGLMQAAPELTTFFLQDLGSHRLIVRPCFFIACTNLTPGKYISMETPSRPAGLLRIRDTLQINHTGAFVPGQKI